VRDISDPENPFAGQYAEWDRWYFEHALRPSQRKVFNWTTAQKEPGFVMESIEVDENGFVLPRLETERRGMAQLADLAAYLNRPSCVHAFTCAGSMPAEMKAALEQSRVALWASALPSIPRWLADGSALAIVLPDGRAITTGPSDDPAYSGGGTLVYRLHDKDGAVVGEAAPGLSWQDLFSPGYTERVLVGASKAGCRGALVNGYVVWLDARSNEVKAMYDYDGSEMPLATETANRPGGLVTTLYADMIRLVGAAQQAGK
jgi:hypothetical protein